MYSTSTAQQICAEISSYMARCGGDITAWYCGIAAIPRDRLFVDHNVNEKNDAWIFFDCGSDVLARQIEIYFHKQGCQGSYGGGDDTTRYIYAYKVSLMTRE